MYNAIEDIADNNRENKKINYKSEHFDLSCNIIILLLHIVIYSLCNYFFFCLTYL